jgi:hypothetical protein
MAFGITKFLWSSGDFGGHARKRLNAYNAWMILFVSIGSLCYGYTANVISATLGEEACLQSSRIQALTILSSTANVHHLF